MLIISVLLLSGCGVAPHTVAEKFCINLSHGKTTEAKQYCTQQTAQLIDFAVQSGSIPVNPDAKFIFDHEEITENTARVYFKETTNGAVDNIDLVRIDGKWKVHMRK